jgi:hypothetical protein
MDSFFFHWIASYRSKDFGLGGGSPSGSLKHFTENCADEQSDRCIGKRSRQADLTFRPVIVLIGTFTDKYLHDFRWEAYIDPESTHLY